MTAGEVGRFTAAAMTTVMEEIAHEIDAPADNARLLRLTNNAVFALPGAGLVIRITRSHRLQERAGKVVQLARWFEHLDAPTIRLAGPARQPVVVNGLAATIWRYLPPAPPPLTVQDLGKVLRHFHALGVPPFPLPAWDPVDDARRRLVDAEGLAEWDRKVLLDSCDRLAPQIAELHKRATGGLVHGDAHVGNLLSERFRCGLVGRVAQGVRSMRSDGSVVGYGACAAVPV
jgi:aminoglycoside phosphotransferase (APT) family kinase protein